MCNYRVLVVTLLLALVVFAAGCNSSDPLTANFLVRISNVSGIYPDSGVFNTPVGASDPSPIGPGESYQFKFTAPEGSFLSMATMMVQSNDLFYAPSPDGLELYPGGTPLEGDITSEFMLWDAGTEVNEEPGVGANQAPRQSGPDTGADENGIVQLVADSGDGYSYPGVSDVIKVTIDFLDVAEVPEFEVIIVNVSDENTLSTSSGNVAVPISPGIFVVHTGASPLFADGVAEGGDGLENLAEDGDPSVLFSLIDDDTGLTVPLSPGMWAVHTGSGVIFDEGSVDMGEGLEDLAEDGDPSGLVTIVDAKSQVSDSGVFDTPTGTSTPGVITPGMSYEFTFTATSGSHLSLATMFVQSNDLFYAFGDSGIDLFPNGAPLTGDITGSIDLWDAGTEVNEYPGYGPNQAPRQSGPDTGTTESEDVMRITDVNDGFSYPADSSVIRVTIQEM